MREERYAIAKEASFYTHSHLKFGQSKAGPFVCLTLTEHINRLYYSAVNDVLDIINKMTYRFN